jgi:hypothetical protein
MTHSLSSHSGPRASSYPSSPSSREARFYRKALRWAVAVLPLLILIVPFVVAQVSPRATAVDPSTGKVNDSVTVTGQNLAKESVSAVFLSDEKDDFKATIVEQTAEKIVMKVPQVKPGDYNVSIQVKDKILIEPVKFKVQE